MVGRDFPASKLAPFSCFWGNSRSRNASIGEIRGGEKVGLGPVGDSPLDVLRDDGECRFVVECGRKALWNNRNLSATSLEVVLKRQVDL